VLGAYDEELVREFFGITEGELAATDAGLAELVGERVALLDVEK
jgi:KEOPS complex subunit Cgi121